MRYDFQLWLFCEILLVVHDNAEGSSKIHRNITLNISLRNTLQTRYKRVDWIEIVGRTAKGAG